MQRVLKADEVAMEGPLQLSIAPAATHGGQNHKLSSAVATPSARVAQDHAEYAIIEVTCACGRTTRIRCDYATARVSSAPAEPAP